MRTYRYTLCRCSGVIEKITVPTFWDPFEVAAKLPHSLVFLHVPAKASVFTKTARVKGPATVLVHDGIHYSIPQIPIVDDRAALHCYKNREEA